MKICIAGKNQIAINCLKYIIDYLKIDKKDIYSCINQTDKGIDSWQPSFFKFSVQNGITVKTINELYKIDDLFFISLEFDKIIKPSKFVSNKLFNIHFSILPKYKGMYTSIFPILNGELTSGTTLHLIDSGIDTGDIIDQNEFQIEIQDTCRDLYFKYLKAGEDLFKKNIENILNLNYSTQSQGWMNSSYFSKNSIDFRNLSISMNRTSIEIHNQIRAFIFREYQLPEVHGNKIIESIFTGEKIKKNFFRKEKEIIELSGIDGYKIKLITSND
jgi:methionyl-tRNA formyltransferase